MASLSSRQNLKDYALRRLGYPVVEINVDDSQLEDRLDDALQFFSEYHYDGSEKVFLTHQITSDDITNEYINTETINDSLISATRLFTFSNRSSNMFDVQYQLALNDFYGWRSSGTISNYDIVRRHMSLIQQILDPEKSIRFSRVTNKLYLDMKWDEEVEAGDFIVIEGYAVTNPEVYNEIYNDMFLKRYVTQLFKRQWGSNLSKFNGIQMPGGVEFNGSELMSQAQEQIDKIEEEMQSRFEEPPHFQVG